MIAAALDQVVNQKHRFPERREHEHRDDYERDPANPERARRSARRSSEKQHEQDCLDRRHQEGDAHRRLVRQPQPEPDVESHEHEQRERRRPARLAELERVVVGRTHPADARSRHGRATLGDVLIALRC